MIDVQRAIEGLRAKGWPLAAIAAELGVFRTAVDKWVAGERYPRNARGLLAILRRLERRRVPKVRRIARTRTQLLDRPKAQPVTQLERPTIHPIAQP